MGGGDVSAIADRIAGRDMDRESAADELDGAIADLALHAALHPQASALADVELHQKTPMGLDDFCFGPRDDMIPRLSEALRLSAIMAESATWAGFCEPYKGSSELPYAFNTAIARTPAWLSRALRIPRSRCPGRIFTEQQQMVGGGRNPTLGPLRYHAIVDRELWILANAGAARPRQLLRPSGASPALWWACGACVEPNGHWWWDDKLFGRSEKSSAVPILAARSMMFRRFEWGVTIAHPGLPGAYMDCSPESARALFADRNAVGGKRRTALRHWVKEHYRRGHTPEESHKVREHLRGIERFTWHGLDVKLQVPSAEIEAAGLLARSGR